MTSPPADLYVGPYRLQVRLGEGGMGVVHLGVAADGTRVAVKVLRPHVVGDEEARRRLDREVASLSRVRTPRVAAVVDADPWGPIPYVATRYVPGLSLTDHVNEHGPVTGADLVHLARGLGEALQAVHAAGVLHRDIKPSNVLLEGRNPVLIDFGLARVADDTRLTRTGWLLGTPGYISPEVLEGHEPTEAADVHGWAATLAFAGLGRPPFGTGPSMAVLERVRRGQVDLADLDPAVRDVVARSLDPDPTRRPLLAEALAAVGRPTPPPDAGEPTQPLVAARDHEPTMAATRTPYRTPPPVETTPAVDTPPARASLAERARRWLLGLGGLVGLAAVVGAAPYLTALAVAVALVALRGLSLTADQAGVRQAARGRRWYDAVLTPLSTPWYLVGSLPMTLLLLLWSAVLVGGVGLVLVALDLGEPVVLWSSGLLLGVVVWTGPGCSRVRGPVRRAVLPLAREAGSTLAVLAAVVTLAGVLVWFVEARGTNWTPDSVAPWRSISVLGGYL